MKFKELLKLIRDDGWFEVRVSGSHRQFKHQIKKGTVTIAGKDNKDVPKGTLNNILKQASLK
ncbi:MAG: type II toxin-antitoxin system HicA family toxin [Ignavibacteria bacterium]